MDGFHQILSWLLVFIAGVSVSFINIMAGGGSVISLSVLMLLGMDATVANGTNRLGILTGNLSGALTYKSEGIGSLRQSLKFGFWALPGAILGAWLAVRIDSLLFQRILGIVMIFVVSTLFLPKQNALENPSLTGYKRFLIHPVLFFIGFYGGFIQAGVGFIIMASLRHLANMKLLNINVFKNHIVLLYTIPIIFLFGFSGKIQWGYAIVLASGNALGAWLSVRMSVRRGDRIIKYALSIAILVMALKLFLSW